MRPASLALLLLALAGLAVGTVAWRNATEESRAWSRLLSFESQTLLGAHPHESEIRTLFVRFGGKEAGPNADPYQVLRLRDEGTDDERVVLLRIVSVGVSFSQSLLWADLIGPDRKKISDRLLLGVNDLPVDLATVIRRPNDPVRYLRLDHVRLTKGVPTGARFLAVDRDTLVLVRAETGDSRLHRLPNPPSVTHTPLLRAPVAWEADLRSDSTTRRLAALAYLGGLHPLPGDPLDPRAARTDGESRSVMEARSHPGVRACILELRKSTDPWIREAAEAVPLDGTTR